MTSLVIDASVALAWCFPDEASDYADTVLVALEDVSILVPAVWSLEVANAILVGERTTRLGEPEIRLFSALLQNLAIVQDGQSLAENLTNVLPLAREFNLTAYDAAYLELALRHNVPLATLDRRLRRAATKSGANLFPNL